MIARMEHQPPAASDPRKNRAPPSHRPALYNNLFSVGSNPRPFVGLTAFWGTLWGQDANGRKTLETFVLQSPYEGLLEPVVGVDGIVRWGAVDLGAAIAYRIAPHSAPYHRNSVTQNLVLLISATLAQ